MVVPRKADAPTVRRRGAHVARSASADASGEEAKQGGLLGLLPAGLVTFVFIFMWYSLNVVFNIQNKIVYGYFQHPLFLSTMHVACGLVYCLVMWAVGLRKQSFGRLLTAKEFRTLAIPGAFHSIGHMSTEISFAAVAISLTHTIKTLQPMFDVPFQYLILGKATSLPIILSLLPIMLGVSVASTSDLSFTWAGFNSAMLSNVAFSLRAVLAKKVMGNMEIVKGDSVANSTAVYAYTTLVTFFICATVCLLVEGPQLPAAIAEAAAHVGTATFLSQVALAGFCYHLYNQFAFNALDRILPVTYGVCNVMKRSFVIVISIIMFGTAITLKSVVGITIALLGVLLYSTMKYREDSRAKRKAAEGLA